MNDIEFENEDAPENKAHEKLLSKVEKLKEELKSCKAERQEYLDGWQRMRADMANAKRDNVTTLEKLAKVHKGETLEDLIPVLDSFDMAMGSDTWNNVDETWRKGIEHIRAQCYAVLERHGITAFGTIGEQFNPQLHEAVQEIDETEKSPNTIVRVVRTGYKMGDQIIRPAQVAVAK